MAVETQTLPGRIDLPVARSRAWRWRAIAPRAIVVAMLLVVLLGAPLLVEPFRADWISLALIYVIVGWSINILMGYAGQVSLGHQAFVGMGAFGSALVVSDAGLSFWVAVAVSAAGGAVAAGILGLIALRLRGLYLALVTLAYGAIAERVLFSTPAITGGGAGLPAPRPAGFTSNHAYVYLVYLFVGLTLFVDWRLVKTKAGRAVQAIREDEVMAASFGINVVAYKLFAFMLSGVFAGIAGSLFAHRRTVVVSVDFSFQLALIFVLMAVVGGLGSRAGIFIGSVFFALFPLIFNQLTLWVQVIGSGLLLLTLVGFAGGIGQQIRPITSWLAGGEFRLKGHV